MLWTEASDNFVLPGRRERQFCCCKFLLSVHQVAPLKIMCGLNERTGRARIAQTAAVVMKVIDEVGNDSTGIFSKDHRRGQLLQGIS
ncbi:MAG TPA: hypothetical protein VGC66_06155 [Pyrinomonadaceae bacterium]|jgi:hypothetical protein